MTRSLVIAQQSLIEYLDRLEDSAESGDARSRDKQTPICENDFLGPCDTLRMNVEYVPVPYCSGQVFSQNTRDFLLLQNLLSDD